MDKKRMALLTAIALLAGNMAVFAEESVSENTENVSVSESAGVPENSDSAIAADKDIDETEKKETPENEPENSNDADSDLPENKSTENETDGLDNQEKDIPENEVNEQIRTESKTTDDEIKSSVKLDEIKQFFKDIKEDSDEYLNELKKILGKIDLPDRKEVLAKLAEIKKKLKDFTIDVFVNGANIDFEQYGNVKPAIKNDRTLAPVRAITEALGADVKWDSETDTITITKGDIVISMKIGSTTANVSGTETELDAAPEIVDGRTLVPMRFIAESMDLNVDWDEASNSIIIE